MPTLRTRASVLATLVALASSPARADVDLTGQWFTATSFPSECHAIVQTGSQLDVQLCDGSGFPWTGTIDPAAGTFTWERGSESRVEATVAPDGTTFSGTVYVPHCTHVGCSDLEFPFFGSRCRGGTVDAGEDCDDGPNPSGTCCTNECRFADAGTICDADADPTTDEACDATGMCFAVPPPDCPPCLAWDADAGECRADVRAGCRRPLGFASRLAMTTKSPDAGDAIAWSWTGDSSTTPADFGDPRDATTIETCVFADEGAGGVAVVMGVRTPAGGICGRRPCWSANGAATTFRHRNPQADGLRAMKLASAGGKTTIRLGGKGAGLGLPATFDDALPPITVQVRRTDAPVCWEARFSTPKTSTATRLRARDGQ